MSNTYVLDRSAQTLIVINHQYSPLHDQLLGTLRNAGQPTRDLIIHNKMPLVCVIPLAHAQMRHANKEN